MSPLAVLAALAGRLGDCPRAPGPCDCLICEADAALERGFTPLIAEAVRRGQSLHPGYAASSAACGVALHGSVWTHSMLGSSSDRRNRSIEHSGYFATQRLMRET